MEFTRVTLAAKPARSRKRLKAGEREYVSYRLTLPVQVARSLGLTGGEAAVVAWLAPARWFHLFDWNREEVVREVLPRLTEREKLELCATLAPETVCQGARPHILLAHPEELQQLGLDPDRPITLEDLVETVKKRLRVVAGASGPDG